MAKAALYRERVTFQQRSLDANNDRLGAWSDEDAFTIPARVVARTRGEVALQQRLQGLQPIEITVHRSPSTLAITSAWRAVWNGRPYNIRATAPDEHRFDIVILAEADQSDV